MPRTIRAQVIKAIAALLMPFLATHFQMTSAAGKPKNALIIFYQDFYIITKHSYRHMQILVWRERCTVEPQVYMASVQHVSKMQWWVILILYSLGIASEQRPPTKTTKRLKVTTTTKSPHHKHNCICTPASLGQSITGIKLPRSCKEWCSSQRYVSYKWSLKCTWPNCMACSECSSEC